MDLEKRRKIIGLSRQELTKLCGLPIRLVDGVLDNYKLQRFDHIHAVMLALGFDFIFTAIVDIEILKTQIKAKRIQDLVQNCGPCYPSMDAIIKILES